MKITTGTIEGGTIFDKDEKHIELEDISNIYRLLSGKILIRSKKKEVIYLMEIFY